MSIRSPAMPRASAGRCWATVVACASPRSPVRSSMSETGKEKQPKAAKADKAPKAEKKGKKEATQGNLVAVGEASHDPDYVPRFKKRYNDVVKAELMKKFGYKNLMQVPKINKIVLNIGAGEGASDGKKIQQAQNDLTAIAGQKAIVTKAK